MNCELCEREAARLTSHHLIPKHKKGKNSNKIQICSSCHRQLHQLFDNDYLARELNTKGKILRDPEMRKFLSWIKKQDPNKRIKVRSGR